jgi:hypothetical protein
MRALAPLLLAASAMGCGEAPTRPDPPGRVCTAIAIDAMVVSVTDASSLARVCDATVVAIEGSFRETLRPFPAGAECTYSGPTERPGSYELEVSRAGFATARASIVRVERDECHVIPVRVSIELRRLP